MNSPFAGVASNLKRESESLPEDREPERKAELVIINADDLGKDELSTRCILKCRRRGRVSSVSAMVFMRSSERAADAALEAGMDVGLHLNFTQPLSGLMNQPLLERYHQSVAAFLRVTKRCFIYNPMLRRQFEYVCRAQFQEFLRLYGTEPSHVDGHEHMHLCANMIMDRVIPREYPVRRSFHFFQEEKSLLTRLYRRSLNGWVSRNFVSTDFFFDLEPMIEDRLLRILALSRTSTVELMVHPERKSQLDYLLSDRFRSFLGRVSAGTWKDLIPRRGEGRSPFRNSGGR